MSLVGAYGAATSGLDSIARQLAVVSQNVANAGTAGYVREAVPLSSATAGGIGNGVRSGPAARSLDQALQAEAVASSADTAGQQVRADALAGIDAASGKPGAGYDLPGLLGAVRNGMSALANDPANQAQQRQVIAGADALAHGVNGMGTAISSARQAAQDGIVVDVATANTALRSLGALSDQIIAAQARGDSVAGLEDARDAQVQVVADLTGARFLRQSNGDLLAVAGGMLLPLRASSGPLVISAATLAPNTPLSAVPMVSVGGVGMTLELTGGRIGASLALRDQVLPALQSGLDGFAQGLASGFKAAGLALFTDPGGAVPAAPSAGFAQTVQVSAAVRAAPSMLRDGAGPAGAAGVTALLDAVLDGPLRGGAGSLAAQASGLTAGIAQDAGQAAATLAVSKSVQSALQAKLTSATGVSVDAELATMVRLQNAYAANAKVMSAADGMWQQVIGLVK